MLGARAGWWTSRPFAELFRSQPLQLGGRINIDPLAVNPDDQATNRGPAATALDSKPKVVAGDNRGCLPHHRRGDPVLRKRYATNEHYDRGDSDEE